MCPPGYFCPEGTKRPEENPCPNGTYSNTPGVEFEGGCIKCDPGRACSGEALTAPNLVCRAGFYCVFGATTDVPLDGVTGDICPSGYHCPAGTQTFNQCPDGTYR